MNVHEINLDVSKQPAVTPVLHLGQGDRNGTTLAASVYDDGSPLPLSGKSVKFAMRSPNGQAYYEADGTVSGNVATFAIDETYAAAIHGTTDVAYVEVLEGETVVCSTNRFRVVVLESAEDGADPEQAYKSGITEATERAIAAAEAAEGVVLHDVPLMSSTVRGGAQLGDGLKIEDGKLTLDGSGSLPTMSATTKGGAKLGDGLTVDANDALNADVTGVKGDAESSYRTGNVSITPANIGAYTTAQVDAALANLRSAILQAQTLLGAIGTVPIANGGTGGTTAAAARSNLDVAQSENAAGSLYDAEQAIADNAAAIATLGESVSSRVEWIQEDWWGSKATISGIYTPSINFQLQAGRIAIKLTGAELTIGSNVYTTLQIIGVFSSSGTVSWEIEGINKTTKNWEPLQYS